MQLNSNHLQALGTIAAALAALIALFVAWDQGRVMRAQQHAAVWPALQLETTYLISAEDRRLSYTVINDGIGPALVEHVSAELDGVALTNWEDLVGLRPEGLAQPNAWTSGVAGNILAPGEEVVLVLFTWDRELENPQYLNQYRQQLSRLEAEICYCSVYGRCWVSALSSEAQFPVPVAQCPAQDGESQL